jgi:uncharacterized protein
VSIELPFDPFPLFPGSHQQTIFGSFLYLHRQPLSFQKLIELSDQDKISLEITTPKKWKDTDPTVIMIHGLCGSHRSPYLVRITKKLEKRGIRAIRFNLRGCGSGKGLAKGIYHCGRSEDVLETVIQLKKEHPNSPIILIGFSMGGSIALKLAGDLGHFAKKYIKKVIAINSPVDIKKTMQQFDLPKNRIYERYFLKKIKAEVWFRHKKFPELGKYSLPKNFRMSEFDEIYTAPQAGFKSAKEYFDDCSAIHTILNIKIDCNILVSQDDPIICNTSLDNIILPSNIRYYKTKKGGHLGYIGRKPFRWIDHTILSWIEDTFKSN